MRWIVIIASKKRRNVRRKGSIEDLYQEIGNCKLRDEKSKICVGGLWEMGHLGTDLYLHVLD